VIRNVVFDTEALMTPQAMIADVTETLIATVSDATSTEAQIGAAAQSFFNAVNRLPVDAVNDAMRKLGDHFHLEDTSRAAFLALVCGALIERGCDPSTVADPLIKRLRPMLESAASLATVCTDRMPKSEDEDKGPSHVFEETREQVASEMPAENAAGRPSGDSGLPRLPCSPSVRNRARQHVISAIRPRRSKTSTKPDTGSG
jgi:hypothetical protein